jgi:uncharacterized protein YhfF
VPGEGAESKVERFWRAYLETLPEGSPARDETYKVWAFGDGPELADELGALVLTGRKTATCFALWEVVAGEETMARVGDRSVILDGRDEPLCVIETTEVAVRRFDEVDDGFAREEGEGDRSLEYWARGAPAVLRAYAAGHRAPFFGGHAARVRAVSGDLQLTHAYPREGRWTPPIF